MISVIQPARRTSLLNQTTEYGLRALAILAALGPGESMRATDLAATVQEVTAQTSAAEDGEDVNRMEAFADESKA